MFGFIKASAHVMCKKVEMLLCGYAASVGTYICAVRRCGWYSLFSRSELQKHRTLDVKFTSKFIISRDKTIIFHVLKLNCLFADHKSLYFESIR